LGSGGSHTPYARDVVNTVMEKWRISLLGWVTISVSRIPLCGVSYLYIRCNEYFKRMMGQEVFLFSKGSRPAMGPTKLSIRRVPQVHFLRI
jgi:hypothetical protein